MGKLPSPWLKKVDAGVGTSRAHISCRFPLTGLREREWGPRKTFFQVVFGVAKLFVAGWLWLPAVGSQSMVRSAFRGTAREGGRFFPAGKVGVAARAPPRARARSSLAAPAPPTPVPPPAAGSAAAVPLASARPHKGSGAPGRASTWRWAGGCGRDCRWAVRSHAGLRFSRRPPGWSLHQKGQVNSPLPSPSVRWLALFGCTANVSHGRKSSFVFFSFGTLGSDGSGWLLLCGF